MSSGLEKVKILVVDDNTHMIKIVKTILRGFDVKDLFRRELGRRRLRVLPQQPCRSRHH